jgi:hypothetical protein
MRRASARLSLTIREKNWDNARFQFAPRLAWQKKDIISRRIRSVPAVPNPRRYTLFQLAILGSPFVLGRLVVGEVGTDVFTTSFL